MIPLSKKKEKYLNNSSSLWDAKIFKYEKLWNLCAKLISVHSTRDLNDLLQQGMSY